MKPENNPKDKQPTFFASLAPVPWNPQAIARFNKLKAIQDTLLLCLIIGYTASGKPKHGQSEDNFMPIWAMANFCILLPNRALILSPSLRTEYTYRGLMLTNCTTYICSVFLDAQTQFVYVRHIL